MPRCFQTAAGAASSPGRSRVCNTLLTGGDGAASRRYSSLWFRPSPQSSAGRINSSDSDCGRPSHCDRLNSRNSRIIPKCRTFGSPSLSSNGWPSASVSSCARADTTPPERISPPAHLPAERADLMERQPAVAGEALLVGAVPQQRHVDAVIRSTG